MISPVLSLDREGRPGRAAFFFACCGFRNLRLWYFIYRSFVVGLVVCGRFCRDFYVVVLACGYWPLSGHNSVDTRTMAG